MVAIAYQFGGKLQNFKGIHFFRIVLFLIKNVRGEI